MHEWSELPSGIRVVTQRLHEHRSVALGAWIACGSRHEPEPLSGATHFLEHLLFKGTPTRSALRIAQDFDATGGDLNAFTTKEFTCVHARVVPDDLAMAAATIADMIQHARLDPGDVESERNVVLEEISLHEDTPDDAVYDLFHGNLWAGHPLGRPVEGRTETVASMGRDDIAGFLSSHYVAPSIVISAAGALDHDALVALIGDAFGMPEVAPLPPAAPAPPVAGGIVVRERAIEQAHVLYGTAGMIRSDERRWALWILNTILGGGMSSRLFQRIREERGLVYNVASGHSGYADTGVFNVYAGCRPDSIPEVLALAREEIDLMAADGPSEEEFARARGHVRGSLVLSFDEPSAIMSHLGRSALLLGEVLTVEQMVAKVEAVTMQDVRTLGRDLFTRAPWALAVLGAAHRPEYDRFVEAA